MRLFMPRIGIILASAIGMLAAHASAFEKCYWAEGETRLQPLSDEEQQELDTQKVSVLYWQVGELVLRAGNWHWEDDPIRVPSAHQRTVPVVKISRVTSTGTLENQGQLIEKLRSVVTIANDAGGALVIDYACPDEELASYSAFLAELRRDIPELAATASVDWIKLPTFVQFQLSVKQLLVRMKAGEPAAAPKTRTGAELPPTPSPDPVQETLSAWSHCQAPWIPAFTNFATAWVYGSDEKPRVRLHNWSWSEIYLATQLVIATPPANGETVFKAERALEIANESIFRGETLRITVPARAALAKARAAAELQGAWGSALILPKPNSDESGWSLRQLRDLNQTTVQMEVKLENEHVILSNTSGADLPARYVDVSDRGYALELLGPDKAWAEARRGDFFDVNGFADLNKAYDGAGHQLDSVRGDLWHPIQGGQPVEVPVIQACRLQFPFGSLKSGASLRTGLIHRTPGVDWSAVRYRIYPVDTEWKKLD